jgi:hypothetical protein
MESDMTEASKHVRMFEESEFATYDERHRNERDRDYYDGRQLTQKERNEIAKRGQPPVIYNRIRRKVNFLLGLEKQSRRDPKAFPRNPQDEGAAQATTDSLRFVCDKESWDDKRSEAWENILIEGTGAIMVGAKEDKDGLTPSITNIPWDRLFYDPHSRRYDFSDANYMGVVTWYDEEEAKAIFEGSENVIGATIDQSRASETYDDRPKWKIWADPARHRVRVTEMYYKEKGEWMCAIFTEKGYLKKPAKSEYLGADGATECPIKAVSLYVDRENNRYGDIRDMIDVQDEINKRRSKGLHLISMRQARVGPNSTMSPAQVRKELARPDGVITSDDVDILQTNDMAAQNLQLLQEAKNEIDLQSANAALSGKNENDMSGRAILAQQQGGMVEIALHMDRLRMLTLSVYEAVWNRIRQYWDAPRWVRVTDDERNIKFVGINQPVTAAQKMQEQVEKSPETQQLLSQDPQAAAKLQQFLASQEAQQVVEIRNNPSEIDVDIIIDEGMDTPTIQAEQWTELTKLAASGIIQIPPDILIQSSQLRDKDKLLESLSQPNPAAEAQQQIAIQGQQAQIEKTQSETAKNMATAEATKDKTEIEAFRAGTQAA